MVATIKHNDAVTVIINVVVLDPCKTCFYTENALRSRLVDKVIQDDSVCRVETTECDICLIVLVDVILLNISTRCINNKNTLTIIAKNLVVQNLNLCSVTGLYTSFPVLADMVIFLDTSEVLFTLNRNAFFKVLFDPIISNDCIGPKIILCYDLDTVLFVFSDFVHHNVGVRANGLNTDPAVVNLTKLNTTFISSLNLDSWTLNLTDIASENLWLSIDTLQINTNKRTAEKVRVLNDDPIISFRNYVTGALFEVTESAIGYLYVRVYGNSTSCMIGLISYEVASD